jgi:hypothetical protein
VKREIKGENEGLYGGIWELEKRCNTLPIRMLRNHYDFFSETHAMLLLQGK